MFNFIQDKIDFLTKKKMDLLSYPLKYIIPIQLNDGSLVQLRPIHPLDGGRAIEFKSSLSSESIIARFHGYIPKVSEKLVKRLTEIDYSSEMAIIAEVVHNDKKEIIAVARIAKDTNNAVEFAIIISDRWQGKNLGSILTDYMIKIAKEMKFDSIYATVMPENIAMLEILRRRGFKMEIEDEETIMASLTITY